MNSKNQGEGNQEAAQEYNEKTQNFVDAGGVEKNKNRHVNLSEEEKKEGSRLAKLIISDELP